MENRKVENSSSNIENKTLLSYGNALSFASTILSSLILTCSVYVDSISTYPAKKGSATLVNMHYVSHASSTDAIFVWFPFLFYKKCRCSP